MKFLYLDAAGDLGYPAPYGKSQTNYYILTGLSIDPLKDWAMGSEKLTEIVRRYFPNKEDSPKELSYTDLIAKKKPFDSLSGEQRKELADEIFDLILELNPVLFAIVIDKLKHKKKYVFSEKPIVDMGNVVGQNMTEPQVYACNQSSYVDYKSAHNILQIQTREFDKIYSLT